MEIQQKIALFMKDLNTIMCEVTRQVIAYFFEKYENFKFFIKNMRWWLTVVKIHVIIDLQFY